MTENELSQEKLKRELEDWWREEENMKLGLLRAIALKGKEKDKYEEVAAELELRKQAYEQIKSLLTPIPEERLGWLKELIREVKLCLKYKQKFYPNDRMLDNLQALYESLRGGKE